MKGLTPISFPVWWYSEGAVMAFRHTKARLLSALRSVGLLIFLRNMFQPLYGDYTRSGRIMSFFVRIVLLVVLLAWTALRMSWILLGFAFHFIALPLAVVMIIYQLFPA